MEIENRLFSTSQLLDAAYIEMAEHKKIADSRHPGSETSLWHTSHARWIGAFVSRLVGVDSGDFIWKFCNDDAYTASEGDPLTRLCENVFEIACVAERLQASKEIAVEDSRNLFLCVLEYAKEFEKNFNSGSDEDYLASIDAFASQKLREEFSFDSVPLNGIHEIMTFIEFERDTSAIWPWRISAEEMLADEQSLRKVCAELKYNPENGFDTDDLYHKLEEVFGINTSELGDSMRLDLCQNVRHKTRFHLMRVRASENEAYVTDFAFTGDIREAEGALRTAAAEYLATEEGQEQAKSVNNHFNWGDYVESIPDSVLARHGLRRLPDENMDNIYVDQDEILCDPC